MAVAVCSKCVTCGGFDPQNDNEDDCECGCPINLHPIKSISNILVNNNNSTVMIK